MLKRLMLHLTSYTGAALWQRKAFFTVHYKHTVKERGREIKKFWVWKNKEWAYYRDSKHTQETAHKTCSNKFALFHMYTTNFHHNFICSPFLNFECVFATLILREKNKKKKNLRKLFLCVDDYKATSSKVLFNSRT